MKVYKRRQIPEDKINNIYYMTIQGMSAYKISKTLGISEATVVRNRKSMNIDYHRNTSL